MRKLTAAAAVEIDSFVQPSAALSAAAGPLEHGRPCLAAPADLRSLAQAFDEHASPTDARAIWHSLVQGDVEVLDAFHTVARWFLVLTPTAAAKAEGLPAQFRSLLGPLLLGQRQKVTALENGVAPSTVSLRIHRGLEQIGVCQPTRRAPAFLALLAHAGAGLEVPVPRGSEFVHASRVCHSISVERPELHLAKKLPQAEYAVLCGLVEGRSYAEIATARRTSMRTVANQVASVFHRLGVSGRNELISFLVTHSVFPKERSGRGSKRFGEEQVTIP